MVHQSTQNQTLLRADTEGMTITLGTMIRNPLARWPPLCKFKPTNKTPTVVLSCQVLKSLFYTLKIGGKNAIQSGLN